MFDLPAVQSGGITIQYRESKNVPVLYWFRRRRCTLMYNQPGLIINLSSRLLFILLFPAPKNHASDGSPRSLQLIQPLIISTQNTPHAVIFSTEDRLESKLLRLRISILQQSAATAAAKAAQPREGEGSSGGSDDEKKYGGEDERDGTSIAAITAKWAAMFEARDRAGTGKATVGDLQAVLENVRSQIDRDGERDGNRPLLLFRQSLTSREATSAILK